MRPALRFSRSLFVLLALALGAGSTLAPDTAYSQAPVVTAPPTTQSKVGCTVTIHVTAAAAPGQTITSLVAESVLLSVGATFTTNASNTEGTFAWFVQAAGIFPVEFIALDSAGLTGSAQTNITITQGPDRPPVITAPASVVGTEGQQFCFTVSAVDPDGDPVQLQPPSPIPFGATFVIGPPARGTFCWTPGFNAAGSYAVNICATSTECHGLQLTTCLSVAITILDANNNQPPMLGLTGDLSVDAGGSLDHPLSASDPDGDALTFSKASGPFFVTVTTTGPTTGNLHASPGLADAGPHAVTVSVSDLLVSDSESLTLTVNPCVCPPVAEANGPYAGISGLAIYFTSSGSYDPLGSPLDFAWDFGDGRFSTDPNPLHYYVGPQTYPVSLTVTNNRGQSATDTTSATVGGALAPAHAFTTGGYSTIRLASGKPLSCIYLEPISGSFRVEDVDPSSVVMVSNGTGSVSEIFATPGKSVLVSDANRNGVPDIKACFAKDDLRQLFSNLPSGANVVTVAIRGNLAYGPHFTAQLTLTVNGAGGALASSFRFDPQTSEGVLTFETSRAGSARVHFFDARGRLVRSLLDAPSLPAGAHDVAIHARGGGAPLAAGIYFYRVVTPEGTAEGRALVLK